MTIYKYNVPGVYNIPLKQVLDVQIQRGKIVVWCIVDEELPEERIYFDICGTGWNVDRDLGTYIGTVQDDDCYVWHVFYEKIKDGKKNEIIEREYESQSGQFRQSQYT